MSTPASDSAPKMHRRIAQFEGIHSVVGLVENALLVAMAGQRYVARCLGQPNQNEAIEKGFIPQHDQAVKVVDFVTEADLTVQEMAEQLLFSDLCADKCFVRRKASQQQPQQQQQQQKQQLPPLGSFVPPIAFIGEENIKEDDRDLRSFKWFEDVVATQESKEFLALLQEFRNGCGVDEQQQQQQGKVENAAFVLSRVPQNRVDRTLLQQRAATKSAAAATTVQIYVDPIDGTNAMIAGRKRVPMTLIGVCLRGVPVAGVANRLFATTATKPATITTNNSVCPPTISVCIEGGPCWIDGRRITSVQGYNSSREEQQQEQQHEGEKSTPTNNSNSKAKFFGPIFTRDTQLQVLCGSNGRARHDKLYRRLEPCEWFSMRGAGCKLMDIALSAALLGHMEQHDISRMRISDKQAHATLFKKQESVDPSVPVATSVNADLKPETMTFDCFVSTGEIKKWDTASPHAFLRWLNADILRVFEDKSSGKVVLHPIDYAQLSGNPEAFSGFDIGLDPRVVCGVNSSALDQLAERLHSSSGGNSKL